MTGLAHGTNLTLTDLQAALTATTERLAAELVHPRNDIPDWSATQWRVARAAAAIHGVSALLSTGLLWRGPPGWAGFLNAQRAHVAERMSGIQAQLDHLDARARAAGLSIVALKGSALHARGLYVPGERPMADIDLLVREPDVRSTAALLVAMGYREGIATWKHRSFEPANAHHPVPELGESATAAVKIELHTGIREMLPVRAVDITQLVLPETTYPGLSAYPSTAALMLHVLLHAAGATTLRELRLLHLMDIARLCAVMAEQDWNDLFRLATTTDDPTLWWAYPPLVLAHRYCHCVPPWVLDRLASACPWLLRRAYRERTITDVSISHLWIDAFPGIEWSGSLSQMARYVGRRLVPSRQTLALRREFAAAQPQVSGGAWAERSQLQRMLRWAATRQAREATLNPVRASMAQLV